MAYVRREYPQWSWSFSRQQAFESCRRMYYYQYYGSHNGWERNAPPLAAAAYRLKQLTNLYTALGDAVHQAAQLAVERLGLQGRLMDAGEVEEFIRRKMRSVWQWSVGGRDQFFLRPKQVPMLHEFYYGKGPGQELLDRINDRITRCAQGLAGSVTLKELADSTSELLACEQFDTFVLHHTQVYAVPDVMYRTSGGRLVIVDWKTGRQEDHNLEQVALYGLYAHEKHNIPPEGITVRLEYLETGSCVEHSLNEEMLAEVREQAQASMAAMLAYLDDVDLNKAKPLRAFPLTDNRSQCLRCNFLELCAGELQVDLEAVSAR